MSLAEGAVRPRAVPSSAVSLPRLEFAIGSMRVVQVVSGIVAVASGLGVGAGYANDARTVLSFGQMFLIMFAAGGIFLAGTLNLARLRRRENTILDRMADERALARKEAAAEQEPVRGALDAGTTPSAAQTPAGASAGPEHLGSVDPAAPTEPFEASRDLGRARSAPEIPLASRRFPELSSTAWFAPAEPSVTNACKSAPEPAALPEAAVSSGSPPSRRRFMHPQPATRPEDRPEKPAGPERRIVRTKRVAGRPRQ